jgi:cyclic lactone autoinducer peptide
VKEKIIRILTGIGIAICSLAVMVAPVAEYACRFYWYQPNEPGNLRDLF